MSGRREPPGPRAPSRRARAAMAAEAVPAPPSASPPPPTVEWVEIIEPKTREHMFANLTTGECAWDPPPGAPVKRASDGQWWELFDQNTSRFYYYNAASQKTVWHRPNDCDIIPLAKLQTLKQNTEVDDEGEERARPRSSTSEATQTAEVLLDRLPNSGSSSFRSRTKAFLSTITQTSPTQSPKAARRSVRAHRHQQHQQQQQRAEVPEPKPRHLLSEQSKEVNYALPNKASSSQRFLHDETARDDHRRTTIGPAQAKYYSIPVRPTAARPQLSLLNKESSRKSGTPRQKSLDSDRVLAQHSAANGIKKSNEVDADKSPFSSLSRSVSFMSRRPVRNEQHFDGGVAGSYTGTGGWKSSMDSSSGRRSVESTPQSGRRAKASPESSQGSPQQPSRDVVSPVEGFCTPMINRRQRQQQPDAAVGFPKRRPQRMSQQAPPPPVQQQQQLSISELVDSGLSTLTDGVKANRVIVRRSNGGPNHQLPQQHHNGPPQLSKEQLKMRRNHRIAGSEQDGKSMSPLQQYILEQAKMSGYRLGDQMDGGDFDRDSYVESEDDARSGRVNLDSSDDFADDEDGISADDLSKTSSEVDDDDDDRYLSEEPTYNNLDPVWIPSLHGYRGEHPQQPQPPQPPQPVYYSQPSPSAQSADVDAFSQEFDVRMRMSHQPGGRPGGNATNSSTMPRPASHQPTSSSLQNHPLQHQPHSLQPGGPDFQQNPAFPVPYEVLHPSLQRNTHSMVEPPTASSTMHRTGRGHANHNHHRQNLRAASERPSGGPGRGSSLSVSASLHSCESDIERYAQDNLNVQRKGLFRRKVSVRDLLTYSKEPIRRPLTCLTDKTAKKEAIELFRQVQIYMGDRRAKPGMTINSVALDVTARGYAGSPALRDEVFVQLCKQTTDNANHARESLRRGWELMAVCLSFFPPSPRFAPALQAYIQRHRDPALDYPDVGRWPIHVQISHYAGICAKRLDRIGIGGRLQPRKPSLEDIDQSRLQIFRPSMFGGTIEEVMELQLDKFPQRRLPWILTTLAEQVVQLGGASTEGIFRVPADLDEVTALKSRFDQWETPRCPDCHTAASLLKLWLRELYEPLIPDQLYERCVCVGDLPDSAVSQTSSEVSSIASLLPEPHRLVLLFLARFLQLFARPDVVSATKMDAANLGTVFAPNCLRCPSDDPGVILENARREMGFVKAVVAHLDTAEIEGIL